MSHSRKSPAAGDLAVRLVASSGSDGDADDGAGSDSELGAGGAGALSNTTADARRNASAAGAGAATLVFTAAPAVLPASSFSAHSLSRALGSSASGSSSHNNHSHSSLGGGGGGGQRDLELVEIGMHAGGTGFDDDDESSLRSASHHHALSDSDSPARPHRALQSDGEDDDDRKDSKRGAAAHAPRTPRVWPSVLRDGWKAYWIRSLREVFLSSKLNVLLLALPVAIVCKAGGYGDGPIFVASLLALCPLAERISFVTDEAAKYTNETLAGLMSATMGNMTELIVSIFALRAGLLRIVQLSLLGSILSNLLLVQGSAFLVGGLKYSQQRFSQSAAKTNVALLILAVVALLMPMVLIQSNSAADFGDANAAGLVQTIATAANVTVNLGSEAEGITFDNSLKLSRLTSVLMLCMYALLVLYQLRTHAHLFEGEGSEDDDDEPPVLGTWGAMGWALVITLFISLLSEFIVSALDGAAQSIGLPVLFIATILLPIVGNAAEHASAIIFARRDQMDIALGISVGSSTQIALFVIPLMVVFGMFSSTAMSLDFQMFESVALLMTVILSSLVLSTGKSDWLYGCCMIAAYIIIAAAFWLQKQPADLQ